MNLEPARAKPYRFELTRIELEFRLDIGTVSDIDLDLSALHAQADPKSSIQTELFARIEGGAFGQSLRRGEQKIQLPHYWGNPEFPILRLFSDGAAVIIDTGRKLGQNSPGLFVSRTGELTECSDFGSAAVDACVIGADQVAVAYHPTSAKKLGYSVEPLQTTGIAFFDRRGRMISSFNHEAAPLGYAAKDVRCLCKMSDSELLFVPETLKTPDGDLESPAVFYNQSSHRIEVLPLPLRQPEAISFHEGNNGKSYILIASPTDYEDQVFAMELETISSEAHLIHLGRHPGIFRGTHIPLAKSRIGNNNGLGAFIAQENASDYGLLIPNF